MIDKAGSLLDVAIRLMYSPKFGGIPLVNSPGTFSMTKKSGLSSMTISINRKVSKFLGSLSERSPMYEKPWHGGPPIIPAILTP